MARATGVEITETEVRVVELDGTDKKYKLLGAAAVPIEADDGLCLRAVVLDHPRQRLEADERSRRRRLAEGITPGRAPWHRDPSLEC